MFDSECRFVVRTKETKKIFDRLILKDIQTKKHNINAK